MYTCTYTCVFKKKIITTLLTFKCNLNCYEYPFGVRARWPIPKETCQKTWDIYPRQIDGYKQKNSAVCMMHHYYFRLT